MSPNVKEAFTNLKEKLQRNQNLLSARRENSCASLSSLDPNLKIIRVPPKFRRDLMETFEKLGWGDAEYFLQTLGNIYVTF